MKITKTLILSLFILSNLANAQDSLYIYKSGSLVTKHAVADIDSVIFYNASNSSNDILSVSVKGQIGVEEDSVNKVFGITMPTGTDLTKLAPIITVSLKATVTPTSGQVVDFSKGAVNYTVTSENGKTAVWSVKAATPLPLITADNSNIKYVGRIDFKTLTAPRWANPGIYCKAIFTGTFCDIDIKDEWGQNYIAVIIDDKAPVRFLMTSAKKTYRVASGLSSGQHTILICKDTEAGVSGITFYGFRCEKLSAITDFPTRKMECYGNSITCGAKMLFGAPCDLVNKGTNWQGANSAYLSYGAVTARALNAQWVITAVSGIGLIQSCCNMTNKMPDTYDRFDLNNAAVKWDFTKYIPDIVTICLGQNDGSTIVASQAFKDKYVEFINTLRGKYPDASIFCVTSPMADSSGSSTCLFKVMQKSLTNIVDSVNKAGDAKVYWVKLPHDQNNGCTSQGHPSEAEHLKTAGVLEIAIRSKMGW
jgi:lysophospholipase L1-like esterase